MHFGSQENGFIGPEPRAVGEFLLREERLDKTQIGEFLGDPAPFCLQVGKQSNTTRGG